MRSFAKSARYMCSPGGDVGKEPRRVFVIQLSEAVQEWRRRHSTSLRQVVTYRNSDTMDHGALPYFESRHDPVVAYFLGLDVGNRWHRLSRANPGHFQDFLRAHQTDGTAGRISELKARSAVAFSASSNRFTRQTFQWHCITK